jgi:hypothetical protein
MNQTLWDLNQSWTLPKILTPKTPSPIRSAKFDERRMLRMALIILKSTFILQYLQRVNR